MSITASAETGKCWVNEYYFDFSTGTIITYDSALLSEVTELIIPESIEGVAVKKVGEGAFREHKNVVSVVIPDTVEYIDESAFYKCESLETVDFGSGLIELGEQAFYGCTSLKEIILPDSVKSIGEGSAFYECTALSNVQLSSSLTSIPTHTFSGCTSLKSVSIPNSVTTIEDYAFLNCISLESVNIPDSVNYIGDGAFSTCHSLKAVNIPDSVKTTGYNVFVQCINLEKAVIGNGLTAINGALFSDCISLRSVIIGNNVEEISGGAFQNCTNLETVCYTGTKEHWYSITIDGGNDALTDTKKEYNYRYLKGASLALDGTLKVNLVYSDEISADIGEVNKSSYSVPAKDLLSSEYVVSFGTDEDDNQVLVTETGKDLIVRYKEISNYHNSQFKTLIDSLELYCIAADAYFTEDGIVTGIALEHKAVISEITPNNADMGENYYGSSLLLKSGTILRHYYTAEVEGYTGKKEDAEGNTYYYIDEIIPAHLYSSADKYCVNDYIYKVLSSDKTDTNLKNLCVALYNYGVAAKAYNGGNN